MATVDASVQTIQGTSSVYVAKVNTDIYIAIHGYGYLRTRIRQSVAIYPKNIYGFSKLSVGIADSFKNAMSIIAAGSLVRAIGTSLNDSNGIPFSGSTIRMNKITMFKMNKSANAYIKDQ